MLKKEDKLYGSNKPMICDFQQYDYDVYEYQIELDGQELYTGRLALDYDVQVDVDIAPIIRDFIEWDEGNMFVENNTNTESIHNVSKLYKFKVTSDYIEHNFNLIYDYSIDQRYAAKVHYGALNYYITEEHSLSAPLFITYYNFTGEDAVCEFYEEKNSMNPVKSFAIPANDYINVLKIPRPSSFAKQGIYYATLRTNKGSYIGRKYFNFRYYCENSFDTERTGATVYYINSVGGVDSLMLFGKESLAWKGDKVSYNRPNIYSHLGKHKNTLIGAELERIYTFNTGILKDFEAAKITELIYSPKVWLYLPYYNMFSAVNINSTNVNTKTWRNDKIVNYTLEFVEDKKYIRR